MLERENDELRQDLSELAFLREEAKEIEKLRVEVTVLRTIARGENEGAYLQRLGEERDELQREVRALRRQLEGRDRELAKQRLADKNSSALGPMIASALEGFLRTLRGGGGAPRP
jgi:hypothetical protein